MKTFSKDSLKIGDEFETYEDIFPKTYVVTEVLQNTFGAVIKGHTLTFWFSFEHAKVKGWTILPDKEENSVSLGSVGAVVNWLDTPYIKKSIKEAIIKNNNELLEQLDKRNAECFVSGEKVGMYYARNIILSKNDSLSKDL